MTRARQKKRSKVSMGRREALTGLCYAALPLAGIAAFFVLPFCITIGMTFTGGIAGAQFVGLANYRSIFASEAFLLAAGNTFRFIGVGVPLIMLISFAIAAMLNLRLRGSDFFRALFVLPMVIPVASVTLVFQLVFEKAGMVNGLRTLCGLDAIDFLHSSKAFFVLVVLYIWKNCGYNIVLFTTGMAAVPKEYYEAAKIDGAGTWAQTRHITLPLLGPTFFIVLILSIINSFKAFREAFALGGAYPDQSIYMLQHFMNNNFTNINYQRLSVAALLTFLVIFAFVFVLYRFSRKEGDLQL